MKDAEELDVPGILKRPEHKNPLSRYEIDRISLNNMGVDLSDIDRVYRTLFVNSVGLFGLLR